MQKSNAFRAALQQSIVEEHADQPLTVSPSALPGHSPSKSAVLQGHCGMRLTTSPSNSTGTTSGAIAPA
jgi:hypothetical protein